MVATELKEKIDSVSDLLVLPWILNKTFSHFRSSLTSLVNGLNKYHSFMTDTKQITIDNNQMEEPVRSLDDNFSIQVFERTLVVKPEYATLNQAVTQLDNYKPFIRSFFQVDVYVFMSELLDNTEWGVQIC